MMQSTATSKGEDSTPCGKSKTYYRFKFAVALRGRPPLARTQ
ncbi:hypothetical protein ACUXG4_006108 [Cupriavidus metallidurans]